MDQTMSLQSSNSIAPTPAHLQILNELSIQLQGLIDSDHFQESLLELLQSNLPFDGIHLWKLPLGTPASRENSELMPRDPLLAYVFEKKIPIILETLPNTVKTASPILSGASRSAAAAPIFSTSSPSELLGILVAESSSDSLSEEHLALLERVATQVALAFRNRELLIEARAFNEKLQSAIQEKTLELRRAHERILDQQKDLQKENKALKTWVETETRGQDLVGDSPLLREILSIVDKVAPTLATVLILGESGTGKELIAKRIHRMSGRSKGPYVTVNCAALQESLLESELFGHEKGSFTGAISAKTGLCEVADGGTLFLDEIGEMSPSVQTKLLRFIQEGEFYRIGGKTPIRVSVRIISATNRDLVEEVKAGRFREDLFYRLNTITMKTPPLRERREDIAPLCEHFLKHSRFGGTTHVKRIAPKAVEALKDYSWPGNVRELQNAIERLKILAEGPEVTLEDIPLSIRSTQTAASGGVFPAGTPLEEVERGHILKTLEHHQGNKTKTAHALGITIKTLYNKLHRYGMGNSLKTLND